jgi:C4-type Zn-finger protein
MDKKALENENVNKINEIILEIEELEAKIAPTEAVLCMGAGAGGRPRNHNETLVCDDADQIVLAIEELEDKIAPGISVNHNQTLLEDVASEDCVLEIEELELKIAPGRSHNHNETPVSDIAG